MLVATFNVQHGRTPGGIVDVPLLARCCASLDADVLGLQEVDRWNARSGGVDEADAVARECGGEWAFALAERRGRGEYGNALVVRGGIDDVEVVELPRWRDEERRVALVVRARPAGAEVPIAVAVTHLGLVDAESATQLDAVIDALVARPGPHLLLGDLNRTPEAVAALTRAGFEVAGGPPTWPAHEPRARLDHVAVRGLALGEVVTPELAVSDHRALVVEVGGVAG